MNDIKGYVEIVKRQIFRYFSAILGNNFNKKILNALIEKYVDIRYLNLEQNLIDKNSVNDVIVYKMQREVELLKKDFDKQEVVEIGEIFVHIIYLDNIGKFKIEKIVADINNFRSEKLNLKENADFSKKFANLVFKNVQEKKQYVDKFSVDYFKLKKKKTDSNNIQILSLTYNIDFPKSFSSKIIQQSFDTGTTLEDKLFVQYRMVNATILEDIIKGKADQQYIVDFAITLLTKKVKLERVLKLISNDYQMDKINLKIQYKDFDKDVKDKIYDLMRRGYKVAVKLDETFKVEQTNTNKLDVFSYIIVNDNLEYVKELYTNKTICKKIIKI